LQFAGGILYEQALFATRLIVLLATLACRRLVFESCAFDREVQ
jgi:hypothetical protein